MAKREKDQADFDLERVMDLFDSALTSKDERVVNALRQLLMITALTAPESNDDIMDQRNGPFRQLQENLNDLYRRLNTVENELNNMRRGSPSPWSPGFGNPYPSPYSPGQWGPDPNMPCTTGVTNPATVSINPGPFTGSMDLTGNNTDATMNIKLSK